MGDYYQNIIFPDVSLDSASNRGDLLLSGLQEAGIVERESDDNVLGGRGYAPGPNFNDALETCHRDGTRAMPSVCGMEFKCGISVWCAAVSGEHVRCRCPQCFADQVAGYFEATYLPSLELWYANNGAHVLNCQACLTSSDVSRWTTWHSEIANIVPFAVGFLGLTFWNWAKLERSRFEKFGESIGSRVIYQYGKL